MAKVVGGLFAAAGLHQAAAQAFTTGVLKSAEKKGISTPDAQALVVAYPSRFQLRMTGCMEEVLVHDLSALALSGDDDGYRGKRVVVRLSVKPEEEGEQGRLWWVGLPLWQPVPMAYWKAVFANRIRITSDAMKLFVDASEIELSQCFPGEEE